MVEQNAKKGLSFADIGYVLVSGETAIAGDGNELLENQMLGGCSWVAKHSVC